MNNNLNDYIVNIANTSYKFKKATVLRIDKAIEHIKKYKKVYKYTVIYLALCLSPRFIEFGKVLIYEFMAAIANQPLDLVIKWIYEEVFLYFAGMFCMFAGWYNLWKITRMNIANNRKRKNQ